MLAMPLPRVVPVRAAQGARPPAPVDPLPVPMRYQDPADGTDVSCGLQALGMALDGLGGSAPTSASMADLLGRAGMLYEYGTGVEELAFAAQSFGYVGSLPFHGATLVDLRSQLDLGHPVVVALGTSGEGRPGHFVTVTGLSADGQWISFNDPSLGPQTLPIDEFLRLWELQGNSGVIVAQEPPLAPDGVPVDAMPWVALMAGVMALVSTTPWGSMRRGVGGRADAGGGGGGKKAAPAPKPAPKTAPKPAPKPAPAPAYKPAPAPAPKPAPAPAPRARFDEEPPVPRSVPRFDTEMDPPSPATAIPTPTPTPVPTATLAPATPTATATHSPTAAPRPRFDEEQALTPMPTPTPSSTTTPAAAQTPSPTWAESTPAATASTATSRLGARFDGESFSAGATEANPVALITPMPQAPDGYDPADVVQIGITPSDVIRWDTRALKIVRAVDRAQNSAAITDAASDSLLRNSVTKYSLAISALASVGTNLYEYGLGEHKDKGVGSQEFWISTGVDFGLSITTGVFAAGMVATGMALAGVVTVTGPVLIAAAALGVGLSIISELVGLAPALKDGANGLIEVAESEKMRLGDPQEGRSGPRGGPIPDYR